MASSSVVKIVTIWLVSFSHLALGQNNDNEGCSTVNLTRNLTEIEIPHNNHHHQSWVKSLTTNTELVALFLEDTRDPSYLLELNISDTWHNLIVTRSVVDKNFSVITVLVPELDLYFSRKFITLHQTLFIGSSNSTVQWTNCSTDNTTVDTTILTPPSMDTTVSTPPSTSTCPPQSTHHPLFLASVVLFFILIVVVWFYVFITWRIHNQLLPERGSNSGQEEELTTYEEWNESWQIYSQL